MRELTAEEARSHTQAFLTERRVLQNPHLPLIEDRSELKPPSAEHVARRILVLSAVIGVGFEGDRVFLTDYLQSNGLWEAVSPREREVLTKAEVTRQEEIDATWLTECVQVLAWSLGLVKLDHFRRCDDNLASHLPTPDESPVEFVSSALLRPFSEIYQECDRLYCLHWAAVHSRLQGDASGLDEGVIRERHKAINWLAGVEADWDEVPTDT